MIFTLRNKHIHLSTSKTKSLIDWLID